MNNWSPEKGFCWSLLGFPLFSSSSCCRKIERSMSERAYLSVASCSGNCSSSRHLLSRMRSKSPACLYIRIGGKQNACSRNFFTMLKEPMWKKTNCDNELFSNPKKPDHQWFLMWLYIRSKWTQSVEKKSRTGLLLFNISWTGINISQICFGEWIYVKRFGGGKNKLKLVSSCRKKAIKWAQKGWRCPALDVFRWSGFAFVKKVLLGFDAY